MVSRRIVLHFPKRLVDRPIVYHLIKDFELEFNILKASVTPEEEGLMVLELKGKAENFNEGVKYLTEAGVKIEPLSQTVLRNDDRCTSCGACMAICPTGAFEIEPVTRAIIFHDRKCLACGLCIKACPPRAMGLHF